MLKNFICVLASVLAFGVYAMQKEDFNVAVRNNYGAQIEVSYTLQGKQLTKVVNLNDNLPLGVASKLSGEVKIYRAGAVVGHLAKGYAQPIQALEQVWAQVKHQYADTLLLVITSSPGKLVVNYHATQKATLEVMKEGEKLKGGVIDQFPGLQKYGLEKTLTPAQILAIQAPNEVVVPAGWIARATTGEDIARYILELPIGYNADAVQDQFKKLSLKWHPDKQPALEGMKETAAQVFHLITHAKDLLTQALRDRQQAK